MMFPPVVLSLFCLVLFLLCLPLGKLPLSFLTLEKRLYLREQDTGQGVHLMDGYPRAVVVDLSFSCHKISRHFRKRQDGREHGRERLQVR